MRKLVAWRNLRAPFLVGTMGSLAMTVVQGQTTNRSLAVDTTNAEAEVMFEMRADPAEFADRMETQVHVLEEAAIGFQAQLDELRLAFRKLVGDNAELKLQLAEKQKTVELLTQNMVVWKTEAELFQEKWEEAHLAASASGMRLMTEGEQRLQKQLAQSIRQLYDAQVERDRLQTQLERLIETSSLVLEKSGDIDPQLKRLAEVQRDSAIAALQALKSQVEPPGNKIVGKMAASDGEAGKVIDVNRELQLVVLNLGRADGVAIGMPFAILRGEAVVGQVKIVDVREKISGALIDKSGQTAMIEVGDRVKLNTAR